MTLATLVLIGRQVVVMAGQGLCGTALYGAPLRCTPSPEGTATQALDPFKPYLAQRWAETDGKVTILDLCREITARGIRGHYSTVRDWARRGLPRPEGFTPAPPPPSVRQVTGWLTRHPATLTEEEKLHRKVVLDHCPELASAAELTSSFAEILTTLSGTRLPDWITEATDANLPGISSFVAGLHSDFDAATAGLTTDWNSGPVEGAVNRIKMLKRQRRPCRIRSPAQASAPRFMTSVSGCWNAASVNDQRYQEPHMGTWGTGPFDSDLAADFVDGLEGLSSEQIIDVLHGAFQRVADSGTRVDGGGGVEAVAAAALVAAQVPGSGIVIDPDDGPKEPLPQLPVPLRALARRALHRVTEDGSELRQGWVDENDTIAWRQEVQLIRDALDASD
ncbi:DUF4259 domain-containing protein [Streptomyces sp. NBC_00019]|uniref:DUF4259 domain-containing protein n=1 Tax=Streptomyces sp. NBC_00019 TaxID=2975623 RepID=UPI00324C6587